MAGYREIVQAIPPLMLAQLAISSPSKSLGTCRIMGSTDPTYGAVGWTPPLDGTPFAVLDTRFGNASYPEPQRVWMTYRLDVFIGITHWDTPYTLENFNDEAVQWMDAMVRFVPANARIEPAGRTLSVTVGDVWWELQRGTITERYKIYDDFFYGVNFMTQIRVVHSVDYQQG